MENFNRENYTFKYFFDCDVDEMGHIDVEGYDVYDKNMNLIAELNFIDLEEIINMSDDELMKLIEKNRI